MAAAASGAERPPAAAHPAPGDGGRGADSTSLAGGGSASLAHSPLLRAKEEGRASRAAGTTVGGLLPRGQPSPPPRRTSTTGGAGENEDEGLEWAAQQEAEARRVAEQDPPGGQHLHRADEDDYEVYSNKTGYEYKDKWTAKHGYDVQSGLAWRTDADQRNKYTEAKYDEKIGKTICWFYNKGQCKKGKNCNFVHEHQQGRPAGAKEAPKPWYKIWSEAPKVGQKDIEKNKQWKIEYEQPEYLYQHQEKKGKDYIGAGDNGGYYNSPNNNKYQRHVSGTPSYSRHVYSFSSAPRKLLQPQG